jgi:hypothetical protein
MEFNPRINISDSVLQESKVIVGSFPTWSLSNSENKKNNKEREIARITNKEIPFFFGSSVNKFWNWYSKYVDTNAKKNDIKSIKNSLKFYEIGITDLIFSCERKGKSSLDKHLIKRNYNHTFLKLPKKGETLKILCTSKGLMHEMLLNKKFFKSNPDLNINLKKSIDFQNIIINKTKGNSDYIRNPFCSFIETQNGGIIECISIPSPGSPYRRLIDFGFDSKDSNEFLDNYLKVVFDWFLD